MSRNFFECVYYSVQIDQLCWSFFTEKQKEKENTTDILSTPDSFLSAP